MTYSAHRTAFFVSDRTGLTAEVLGRSLLSQFEDVEFHRITLRYIDTPGKVRDAIEQINEAARSDGQRPLVLSTLTSPALRNILAEADALVLDLFEMFITPLENELGTPSSHAVGRSHSAGASYSSRMDAVNFSLDHDDGGVTRNLERAEIVLVGVSRCGKTPTSLYLAMQFGIYTANYPLVEEDFDTGTLPAPLVPMRKKLFGLTISPERLHQIRSERSPNSRYASLENCRHEVQNAERMMHQFGIPFLDITSMSVEEIATTLVHQTRLKN
jgi:regulator of PEP synthase PpsR (kinase-PPPase family)